MKYIDEYRDAEAASRMVEKIHRLVTRPWVIMEVCGGQTHTIVKYGIDELLPEGVTLIHGPGCPVCVTPLEMIEGTGNCLTSGYDLYLFWRYAEGSRIKKRPFCS
jgi:hydrogenase expression/formation protein HypD